MKHLVLARDLFQKKQIHLNLICSLSEVEPEHTHDFYEIFIITEGCMVHCVNGMEQILKKGHAVLIRPNDVHAFNRVGKSDCEFLNFAFSGAVMLEICRFLDIGIQPEQYSALPQPPVTCLPDSLVEEAKSIYQEICLLDPESRIGDAKGKMLIARLIEGWFLLRETERSCPEWFHELEEQMRLPEVFSGGLPKLSEISGKTPEHLCRSFRKYRGISPMEALTSLRMAYAANLLRMSSISILDISMECGYTSLSHFYSRFRTEYHLSPAAYRSRYQFRS